MKILVTGGAGYIGSHMLRTLGEKGHDVVVYDNLSSGHEASVLYGRLVVADLSDTETLGNLFEAEKFDAVMHFAAHIEVGESVRNPLKYYRNNFSNALNLIGTCVKSGVNKFVFSSTAAVYGVPDTVPITEKAPVRPVNPYGSSKAMVERVLDDTGLATGLRYVSLRYFNAAGADPQGRIGEMHDPETHLIPLAIKAAMGKYKAFGIFGTDYDTPDGTCIRDYIHVDDLTDAHVLALDHLASGNDSGVFNCGYGRGYSVREVVETARKVTGIDFPVRETGRRAGDPPSLVADSSKLRKELGWNPSHDNLEYIIKTAWEWEKKLKDSF
jgi:UDP-glucose 4-epimerase